MQRHGLWNAPKPDQGSGRRLFCLPFAGGDATAYYRWAPALAESAQLWSLQLPGRGARFNEPLLRHRDEVVPRVVNEMTTLLDRPYILFGHSMGGRLAAAVCLELAARQLPLPYKLICSGSMPAHCWSMAPHLYQVDDDALVTELLQLGGTPPEVLADRRLLSPFMPALRADFELFESCRWQGDTPLPVDLEVWAGLDDPRVPPELALRWTELAGAGVNERFFKGGHMFLADEQSGAACLGALKQLLLEPVAPWAAQITHSTSIGELQ